MRTEELGQKAVGYGESHIRQKTMPLISSLNRDLDDLEGEIEAAVKKLKEFRERKQALKKRVKEVPREWDELQKSINALKKPREAWKKLSDGEYEEMNRQHRMKISEYTGVKTFLQ